MNKRALFIIIMLCLLTMVATVAFSGCTQINNFFYGDGSKTTDPDTDPDDGTDEECEHDWQLSTNGMRSTCQKEGYELYICSKCKAEERRPLPLSGHVYANNVCVYCGAKAPARDRYSHGGATLSVYSSTTVNGEELQLIFEGDGSFPTPVWADAKTKGKIRSVRVEGKIGLPDNAFINETILNDFTVLGSVTRIGKKAFAGCTSLTSLSFGKGLQYVGDEAFAGCTSLTSAAIIEAAYMGKGVFSGCERLRFLSVPFVGCDDFIGASVLFGSIFDNGTEQRHDQSWEETYFSIPDSLEEVTVTGGNKISSYAFANCSRTIDKLTIASSVKTIESHAFCNNGGIEEIAFEDGSELTAVEEYAFDGCSALKTIELPAGVTVLPQSAFSRCRSLEKFTFEEGSLLTSVKVDAFRYCVALESIDLPQEVVTVESNAFYGCSALSAVRLNKKLHAVGENAFYGCSFLKSVYVLSEDVANADDNLSRLFASGDGFDLWIEKSITVSPLGYVGKNCVCPMSHITTEKDGYEYYLWQNK